MGQFSDDGQWFWDGKSWVATAQVVLPQLPPTEFEQSGRLKKARDRLMKSGWLNQVNDAGCVLSWIALIPHFYILSPALRDYRSWTLEQMALATAYVLGPNELIVASEATIIPPQYVGDSSKRDFAVVVTQAHVLIFRIDHLDGQPRWIALVAHPTDVTMEVRSFLAAGFRGPALTISGGDAKWAIRGEPGVWKPNAVVEAWRARSTKRVPT
jgi:hypothetical protein